MHARVAAAVGIAGLALAGLAPAGERSAVVTVTAGKPGEHAFTLSRSTKIGRAHV